MSKVKKKFSKGDETIALESDLQIENSEELLKEENPNTDFHKALESAVEDLWYMSETDAEIDVFIGKKADNVSKEALFNQINNSSNTFIEEKSAKEFFKNLTEIQDWFGDEEKATAEKFSKLENLLEENLKDLKVFKIGQIEIDIYIVGLDSQEILTGIKTKAVET